MSSPLTLPVAASLLARDDSSTRVMSLRARPKAISSAASGDGPKASRMLTLAVLSSSRFSTSRSRKSSIIGN